MRRHSDDIVTAAGHDQPKDRDTDQADRDTERPVTQSRAERDEMPRQRSAGQAARPKPEAEATRLFPREDAERFRGRLQQIQTGFVDDPRAAVQGANDLLAEVIRALAAAVNEQKQQLEGQWRQSSGEQTEELRLALRRYRSFANRLLEV